MSSSFNTLDEESFLLGINDVPEEHDEYRNEIKNQANFQRTTINMIGALVTVMVLGTVAVRVSSFSSSSSSIQATSLWTMPSSVSTFFEVRQLTTLHTYIHTNTYTYAHVHMVPLIFSFNFVHLSLYSLRRQ